MKGYIKMKKYCKIKCYNKKIFTRPIRRFRCKSTIAQTYRANMKTGAFDFGKASQYRLLYKKYSKWS